MSSPPEPKEVIQIECTVFYRRGIYRVLLIGSRVSALKYTPPHWTPVRDPVLLKVLLKCAMDQLV